MSRNYWENIKNKLRQKWQILQHGPYTKKFEVLFKEYLTKNYGLEAVQRLWNDHDTWWEFADTPGAKELAAEIGFEWAYHPESIIWDIWEKNVEEGFPPDEPFFRDVFAVKLIPYGKIRWSDLKKAILVLQNGRGNLLFKINSAFRTSG